MYELLPELQATLHHEIPLSRALGITVAIEEPDALLLRAPLAPNINHKDTAFAGSLNAVLTLAGWSVVWLLLNKANIAGKVVIQDSSISYKQPVATDFVARCIFPPADAQTTLLTTLQRRGRARIELAATICEAGNEAVMFRGRYVAQRIDINI